jgi:hypothetical protein
VNAAVDPQKKVRSPDLRPGFAVFLGLIAVLPFQAVLHDIDGGMSRPVPEGYVPGEERGVNLA